MKATNSKRWVRRAAGGLLCLATSTAFAAQVLAPNSNESDLAPSGKGWGERAYPSPPRAHPNPPGQGGKSSDNGIYYHGGPVMLNGTNVYYIWYGNWSGNSATTILTNLAGTIGKSPYFNINTTYYDGFNRHVSNVVTYGGFTNDSYSQGTALSDAAIQAVVANAITSGKVPNDTKGVYFVLTSADVTATSGFCTQYCGWHTHGTIAGSDIKYSFVGNPDRCPNACSMQSASSPNNNPGADGMASVIAHELQEATTDPDLNAWYDRRGYENADKCAWTFGKTSTASNGSLYNVTLAGSQYLIQQNWVNASGGYCAMSY
jgi:hypothetical protein